MRLVKLLGINKRILSRKLLASIRDSKASLDLLPPSRVIRDIPTEPHGEPIEVVVVVGAAEDGVRAGSAGDGEGEDEEDDEEHDERRHGEEVEGEEAAAVPVGADEAGERGEEEEAAEDGDRPPGEARALVPLRGCEPDARCDDGDRAD